MAQRKWIIKDLLRVSTDYLKERGLEDPKLSAEVLLAHQLKVDRIRLYLDFEKPLTQDEIAGYRSLVRRRADREPLQYITGCQEFWSADFLVRPGVLIPRPESELLVEQALEIIRDGAFSGESAPRILDLGTGSGALIISLGLEIRKASLWASDISDEALAITRENARRHGLEERIEFMQGDLFEPARKSGLSFDIVLSNPPYITSEGMVSLMPEVRHEPRVALDGGQNGTDCIEKIIRHGADFLRPNGWLLVEMDPEQVNYALNLIHETGRYANPKAVRDYARRYRVVVVKRDDSH